MTPTCDEDRYRVLRDSLVINANAHAAVYKGIEFYQVLLFLLPRGVFLMRIVKPNECRCNIMYPR